MKLKINQTVRVHLTQTGLDRLTEDYATHKQVLPPITDGWLSMPLDFVMNLFGPDLYPGAVSAPFDSIEILDPESAAMTQAARNEARAEKHLKRILCDHKNTSGGNDYLACNDCGAEWDYRKGLYDPKVDAREALAALAPPPAPRSVGEAEASIALDGETVVIASVAAPAGAAEAGDVRKALEPIGRFFEWIVHDLDIRPGCRLGDEMRKAQLALAAARRLLDAPPGVGERMREALEKIVFPSHGEYGGPLVSVRATYEDGSEKWQAHEVQSRARAALATPAPATPATARPDICDCPGADNRIVNGRCIACGKWWG